MQEGQPADAQPVHRMIVQLLQIQRCAEGKVSASAAVAKAGHYQFGAGIHCDDGKWGIRATGDVHSARCQAFQAPIQSNRAAVRFFCKPAKRENGAIPRRAGSRNPSQ